MLGSALACESRRIIFFGGNKIRKVAKFFGKVK